VTSYAPGRLVFRDHFDAGATWDPALWDTPEASAGSSADVAVGVGRMRITTPAGGYADWARALSKVVLPPSFEAVCRMYMGGDTVEHYPTFGMRSSDVWNPGDARVTNDAYSVIYIPETSVIEFQKSVAGTNSIIFSDSSTAAIASTEIVTRVRMVGPRTWVKWWKATTQEPAAWKYLGVHHEHSGPTRRRLYLSVIGGAPSVAHTTEWRSVEVREIVEGRRRRAGT